MSTRQGTAMGNLIGWVPVFVAAFVFAGIVVNLVVPRIWPLSPQKTELRIILTHEHTTIITSKDYRATKPNTTHNR